MARGYVQQKKGHYYIHIIDDEGRETTRSVKKELGLKKEPTEKQAQNLLQRKLIELETSGVAYDAKITVADFMAQWLESKKRSIEFTTYDGYQMAINNHINPHLGKIGLNKLNKATVQKFVNQLCNETGVRTVRYTMMILKQALTKAVEWELLARNPADNIELPKEEHKEKTVWTNEELARFLSVNRDNRLYPLFLLAITTGMRRGEMLALTWPDINFDTGVITVNKSITVDRIIKDTKSKSSHRKISAPDFVINILREHRLEQMQWYLAAGIRPDNNAVFTTSKGTYFRPDNILGEFKKACKAADVPIITLHALRHLHVSILLQVGTDPKAIQHRVGHAKCPHPLDTSGFKLSCLLWISAVVKTYKKPHMQGVVGSSPIPPILIKSGFPSFRKPAFWCVRD